MENNVKLIYHVLRRKQISSINDLERPYTVGLTSDRGSFSKTQFDLVESYNNYHKAREEANKLNRIYKDPTNDDFSQG